MRLSEIDAADETMRMRPLHIEWVAELAANIKLGGALDPIHVWLPGDGEVKRPIILDGHHRFAAYKAAGWKGAVPVEVHTCDRAEALLIVADIHKRAKLPATAAERSDFAWRIVREIGLSRSADHIAKSTGLGKRTIERMRRVWKAMQADGRAPTGGWYQDNRAGQDEAWTPEDYPDQDAVGAAVEHLTKDIRNVLDHRRKDAPLIYISEVRLRALSGALGDNQIRDLYAYTFGGHEEAEEERRRLVDEISDAEDAMTDF